MLEWLLGITSSLLCVHVCECLCTRAAMRGTLKRCKGSPFGLIFLCLLCVEIGKVSEWSRCCRNFMNGAKGRLSRRGAGQGDAGGSAGSGRSCHSKELLRQAPARHKPPLSPRDTKRGSCKESAPEPWKFAPENELSPAHRAESPVWDQPWAQLEHPLQSCSFLTEGAADCEAEEQPQLPGQLCLLQQSHFRCQHSSDTNMDKRDNDGAGQTGCTCPTAGGHCTAQQEQEEGDLGLQGPRNGSWCW